MPWAPAALRGSPPNQRLREMNARRRRLEQKWNSHIAAFGFPPHPWTVRERKENASACLEPKDKKWAVASRIPYTVSIRVRIILLEIASIARGAS